MSSKALPEGWCWTKIGDLGQIVAGGTPSTKIPEYWENEVAWITPADLSGYQNKFISKGRKSISKLGLEKSSAKLMPQGSILFSSRAPIGYAVIAANEICTNQGFKNLIPSQLIFNEYVYYFLKSAKNLAESYASGTTFKEITARGFAKLPLPLPPFPEQHAIVEKLEELFSDLDDGVASLKQAQAQLKTYRQAVLKYAFEGKLTAAWRETNRPAPAAALLEQIQVERAAQYQRQLEEWQQACARANVSGAKKPPKPQKPKTLPPLSAAELAELPKLPAGWCWVRLSEISEAFGGYAFKSQDFSDKGKYQVIKIANVKVGQILLDSNPAYLENADEESIKKYGLQQGDCLITLTGTRKKRDYGFVAMVKNEQNLLLNQRLAAIRFFQPILPDFYQYALRTQHFQNNFFKYETGNVGQGNVGMKSVTEETIIFPPLAEQRQIVQEIEARLSVCDQLEQTIAASLRTAESLRQSLLKHAFEGKLTADWRAQHPDLIAGEHAAAALLEKIRKEKIV
ncbi:restriction modification system DNA specificity subunit [Candidatus Vecturithrix granuli]|uniref:Restriction modification system DNA specificity subunit n=1 Tax=Vecturithrix granuli TaxID=1499967 RepID=A0A081C2K8_VECG1|nr:restriction modification system DNA specificity subunit [Candidatus Vecturithrix granuli]